MLHRMLQAARDTEHAKSSVAVCRDEVSTGARRFHPLEETFIIEVCCGAAGFTAAARSVGFRDSVGIYHIRSTHVKAAVICLDIAASDGQQVQVESLQSPLCRGVLIARALWDGLSIPEHPFGSPTWQGARPLQSAQEPNVIYPLSVEYMKRAESIVVQKQTLV